MPIIQLTNSENSFEWIDIANPTEAELMEVSNKYQLHQYTLKDCLEPDHLPKYEDLGDFHFIITRILVEQHKPKTFTIQSLSSKVAIFYNEKYLITIHRLEHQFIHSIKQRYVDSQKCKSTKEVVTKIVWNVLHSYDKPILNLSQQIDEFEEKVFLKSLNNLMIEELYFIRHQIAICSKLLMLSGEIINSIKANKSENVALQDVKDLHIKLITLYNQAHEDVTNLLNIYLSLSSQKTNEVMKVLTIFSVFFMPLTFIVGIYGMNFKFMPELESKLGYPLVLITMLIITAIIYFWFKRKRWL
jgi:magnesium transporter